MKTILPLLLSLALPLAAAAHSDASGKKRSRAAANTTQCAPYADDELVLRPQGSQLLLGVAGYGIVLGDRNSGRPSVVTNVDERKDKRVSVSLPFSSIELGFNVLTGVDYTGAWAGDDDFLELRTGKSIHFAFRPLDLSVALDRRNRFRFGSGLRYVADNYSFIAPHTLARTDGELHPLPLDPAPKKSKFVTSWIGIPVEFTFVPVRRFHISLFAAGDVLLKAHTKYKKPKTKQTLGGFSQWRCTAGVSVTYRGLGVYASYSPTPLFESGAGPKTHTMSVGLAFGF